MQKNQLTKIKLKNFLEGFSKLTRSEREQCLIAIGLISPSDLEILRKENALQNLLAEQLIENVISIYQLPLGIAVNFIIDEKPYVIPMVTEETSIVAAASYAAKWIGKNGKITTKNLGRLALGQIHIPKVQDFIYLKTIIKKNKSALIKQVNENVAFSMASRGGGLKDIILKKIPRHSGETMAVIHVLVDTCDAMGANIINQVCEYLKPFIEQLTHEKIGICILSNLTDDKLCQANVVINNIDPQLGEAISEASLFGLLDPYRAATNNKGVMNGIDAVLLATGNDWRAVEAGIHAYAALSGQYKSITQWYMKNGNLYGELIAPISVGIVGGVTSLHPIAKLSLKILDVHSAAELARVVAAVGLVQNFAALKALVSHGIVKGHMKLHLTNLALASGATNDELPILKQKLTAWLKEKKFITHTNVIDLLHEIRKNK